VQVNRTMNAAHSVCYHSPKKAFLGTHVGVRTSKRLRFIDILVKAPSGELLAIEVKSGGAVSSAAQLAKDAALANEGGILVGKNVPFNLRDAARRLIQTIERHVP
jgi:hypothetical protein